MCKLVHIAKYTYVIIFTKIRINFLEEVSLIFIFITPKS